MLNFIHSRLGFGQRLGLISAAFCLPIALLLWLFFSNLESQIQVSVMEIDGQVYIQQIWDAAQGSGSLASANDKFKEADLYRAFTAATDPTARLAAGMNLLDQVGDGSSLTLDTDLDSYYTMDAADNHMAEMLGATSDLKAALAAKDAVKIAVAVNHIGVTEDDTNASLQKAMKANADGSLRGALASKSDALTQAVAALRAATQPGADPVAATAAVTGFDARLNDLFSASGSEIERLIKIRVGNLTNQLYLGLGVVAAVLAASAFMVFFISRGLSTRIRLLLNAMERLSRNDTDVDVPCASDRNETGRIAAALTVFKAGIIERNHLQAEAAATHEANERKLRDVEAAFRDAGQAQAEVVETLASALSRLSDRDLTVRVTQPFSGEHEKLKRDFNGAVEGLERAIGAVAGATDGLRTGIEEIATASDDLSRRTEQQAASLEETAAALDEITATVKKTAQGARQASEAVGFAKGVAEQSGDVVRDAVAAMGEIERSSQKISQIIGVIDEIAFQTNLLALNAGVEAARAGDAGRGFAVVAQEVRALAQRSAEAAKEIKALISTSSRQVGQGVDLVAQTGAALESIVTRVGDIASLVSEISASAQEQATGLNEVNTAVNQMDQVVQQNAAMVEQSTAASHSLKGETGELVRLVGEFRLAGGAHRAGPHLATSQAAPSHSPARALRGRVAASFGPTAAAAATDGWEEF